MEKEIKMKKIVTFFKGVCIIFVVIMWFILLPFIFLYDRIFGGWKK